MQRRKNSNPTDQPEKCKKQQITSEQKHDFSDSKDPKFNFNSTRISSLSSDSPYLNVISKDTDESSWSTSSVETRDSGVSMLESSLSSNSDESDRGNLSSTEDIHLHNTENQNKTILSHCLETGQIPHQSEKTKENDGSCLEQSETNNVTTSLAMSAIEKQYAVNCEDKNECSIADQDRATNFHTDEPSKKHEQLIASEVIVPGYSSKHDFM